MQSSTRGLITGVVLGTAFGAPTSLSNSVSSDSVASLSRVPSLILDAGWAWAALAVLAGWLAARPLPAAVAGGLALLAGTGAYYGVDSIIRDESFASYRPEIARWWLASVLLGSLLGLIGAMARPRGVVGLACRLAVPAGAMLQLLVSPPGEGTVVVTPAATWARATVALGAILGAVAAAVSHVVTHQNRRKTSCV